MMNPKVDFFFKQAGKWQEEVTRLRDIALACGLDEQLKWGCPCYVLGNANVVLIHCFKEYCAFLFFKGALLSDRGHILTQQTENVQSSRQARFSSLARIMECQGMLTEYIFEAIEVEKAGLKVPMKKTAEFAVPAEFGRKIEEHPALKAAFDALTPGRQRAYLLHFSSAKQEKTRWARIEKWLPHILAGKGLDD